LNVTIAFSLVQDFKVKPKVMIKPLWLKKNIGAMVKRLDKVKSKVLIKPL
jgi:hypothetical protein